MVLQSHASGTVTEKIFAQKLVQEHQSIRHLRANVKLFAIRLSKAERVAGWLPRAYEALPFSKMRTAYIFEVLQRHCCHLGCSARVQLAYPKQVSMRAPPSPCQGCVCFGLFFLHQLVVSPPARCKKFVPPTTLAVYESSECRQRSPDNFHKDAFWVSVVSSL